MSYAEMKKFKYIYQNPNSETKQLKETLTSSTILLLNHSIDRRYHRRPVPLDRRCHRSALPPCPEN